MTHFNVVVVALQFDNECIPKSVHDLIKHDEDPLGDNYKMTQQLSLGACLSPMASNSTSKSRSANTWLENKRIITWTTSRHGGRPHSFVHHAPALGGITPPAPDSPYPYSEEMCRTAFSPKLICITPSSHPVVNKYAMYVVFCLRMYRTWPDR